MGMRHLKRVAAPSTYRIPRKIYKFAVRVAPGPHGMEESIPVSTLLVYVLNIARNNREVKYILRKGYLKIDGKEIKDHRFPVGLMDVIELVPTREFFRVLPSKRYYIDLIKIREKEAKIKPCQIKRKLMVKGGRIQLTTHDGRNFLFEPEDENAKAKPGDVLILNLSKRKVEDYIPFEKDIIALIVKGAKMGEVGRISEVLKVHPLRPRIVRLVRDGTILETLFRYVFPIGREKPIITLHGEVESGE